MLRSSQRMFLPTRTFLSRVFRKKKESKEEKIPLYKRIGLYILKIGEDYKMALEDMGTSMKANPIKSAIAITGLTATGYVVKKNPTKEAFREKVVECAHDLLLVGDPIRSRRANNHVQYLLGAYNVGIVRRFSLGVCCVMWLDNYDSDLSLYNARCGPLKVGWMEMWNDRIVDVGVLGRWLTLEKIMVDYDVNEEEWADKL